MEKRILFSGAALALLGLVLLASPGLRAGSQDQDFSNEGQIEQKMQDLQTRIQEMLAEQQERIAELAHTHALRDSEKALAEQVELLNRLPDMQEPDADALTVLMGEEGASWLGVETQEVTADKAKELKLPEERGVVLQRIVPDSPAAKAGLKENDVVTEINGQRVEGSVQFRRMIHEIPAGRTVQFTLWRDGRAQTISVTLGKSEEHHNAWMKTGPGAYAFHLPDIQIPEFPGMEWNHELFPGARPRLGIDAEDLNDQLGEYFGAPDGEGVLVRAVNPGSPAEKAGVKAGDVITSIEGERIHSVGELRVKLAEKRENKSVKLGILRNKSQMMVTVELPVPQRTEHRITHRTNI